MMWRRAGHGLHMDLAEVLTDDAWANELHPEHKADGASGGVPAEIFLVQLTSMMRQSQSVFLLSHTNHTGSLIYKHQQQFRMNKISLRLCGDYFIRWIHIPKPRDLYIELFPNLLQY